MKLYGIDFYAVAVEMNPKFLIQKIESKILYHHSYNMNDGAIASLIECYGIGSVTLAV